MQRGKTQQGKGWTKKKCSFTRTGKKGSREKKKKLKNGRLLRLIKGERTGIAQLKVKSQRARYAAPKRRKEKERLRLWIMLGRRNGLWNVGQEKGYW